MAWRSSSPRQPSDQDWRATVRRRLRLVLLFLVLGFGLVVARLVDLQVIQAEELARRAERQHFKRVEVQAERGAIFDRNRRVLALDVKAPSLYILPQYVSDIRQAARRLAPYTGMTVRQMTRMLERHRHFIWLERKTTPQKARAVLDLKIRGVGSVMESRRFYPKGVLLGQLLGFTGVDHRGIEGVERAYDGVLRGEEGAILFHKDAAGRAVFPQGFDYRAPSRGHDLVLTIDEFFQHVSERELDRVVTETKARAGMVIIMDPVTGELLAWAMRPAFDPNAMLDGRRQELVERPEIWRNRVITDVYEPGSTFKIVLASAAIQEQVVTPHELIDCQDGSIRVAGSRIRDPFVHGLLTFSEVIARSSNVGIIQVAMRLGDQRFYDYVRAFGFGEVAGIDLAGEVPGLLRGVEEWSKRSLATLSMGQEIGVTPLQMVTAVSAIANGGLLMRPHVVREVVGADGRVLQRFSAEIRRRVLTPEAARQVGRILVGVSEPGGTGVEAAVSGYRVAGKTGTAQVFDPASGRYSRDRFVSSFVGFVPAESPRLAILVIIEEPQGKAWGGVVAAPVFGRIAQDGLKYLGVPANNKDQIIAADLHKT